MQLISLNNSFKKYFPLICLVGPVLALGTTGFDVISYFIEGHR